MSFSRNWLCLLILLMIFSTCTEDSISGNTNDSSDNSGDFKDTITIGFISEVGPGKELTNPYKAAVLAASEINSSGGLYDSIYVDIEVQNVHPSVENYVDSVMELHKKGINCLIGPGWSSTTLNLVDSIIKNNMIMIPYSATSPSLSKIETSTNLIFRTCPSDAFAGAAAADYLYDSLGIRSIANICQDDTWGKLYMETVRSRFAEKGGDTLGYSTFPADCTSYSEYDFSSVLSTIFDSIPEAIITADFKSGIYLYSSIATNENFNEENTILFSCENMQPGVEDLVNNIPFQSTPTIYGLSIGTISKSNNNWYTFKENFDTKYNDDVNLVLYTAAGYDAMYLLCYSILKAGVNNLDSANLIANELQGISKGPGTIINANEFKSGAALILSGNEINYEGVSGSIDFNDDGDVSALYEVYKVNFATGIADTIATITYNAY